MKRVAMALIFLAVIAGGNLTTSQAALAVGRQNSPSGPNVQFNGSSCSVLTSETGTGSCTTLAVPANSAGQLRYTVYGAYWSGCYWSIKVAYSQTVVASGYVERGSGTSGTVSGLSGSYQLALTYCGNGSRGSIEP